MDKAYDIGILLYGSRFTEIGEDRAFVLTRLCASVQQGEGDDGYVELLCESHKR